MAQYFEDRFLQEDGRFDGATTVEVLKAFGLIVWRAAKKDAKRQFFRALKLRPIRLQDIEPTK